MWRFPKAQEELTPDQIAERDLNWLLSGAASASLKGLLREGATADVVAFLRGIARTCNKTALHYEQQLGPQGKKPKNGSN